MAKLVILNQGMTGRTFDLNVERTTVGRVEDNTFQIADGSVSSHHAEVILRGTDVVIKDLDSTNGSFINNERITEAVLKPGQILRFGQVELKIDDGKPAPAPGTVPPLKEASSAPLPPPPTAPSAANATKGSSTMVMSRGVSLADLEQGSGVRPSGFDSNTAFSKKKRKGSPIFLISLGVAALVIIILILYAISQAKGGGGSQ
jgi:pSer/pThr/pTyr-binding forkhead associated (FHA) protein